MAPMPSRAPLISRRMPVNRPTCGIPRWVSNGCPENTSRGGRKPGIATRMYRIGQVEAGLRPPAAIPVLPPNTSACPGPGPGKQAWELRNKPAEAGSAAFGSPIFALARLRSAWASWSNSRGSLLRTRQKERDVVDFSLSCHETAVLPTWGTTELLQAQGFGQAFLDEALGGDHGGGSIRTRTLGG